MCFRQENYNIYLHCVCLCYVDDINIIGNKHDINEARHLLKAEFEMKDLGQTKFF
jgi:hypothetical protein